MPFLAHRSKRPAGEPSVGASGRPALGLPRKLRAHGSADCRYRGGTSMGTPTSVATVIFRSQRMQFDLMPVVPRDWNIFSRNVCTISWLSKLRPASIEHRGFFQAAANAVLGVRRRDALGSGDQGHHNARVRLRASYMAVLELFGGGAADDIYSREDADPNSAR